MVTTAHDAKRAQKTLNSIDSLKPHPQLAISNTLKSMVAAPAQASVAQTPHGRAGSPWLRAAVGCRPAWETVVFAKVDLLTLRRASAFRRGAFPSGSGGRAAVGQETDFV